MKILRSMWEQRPARLYPEIKCPVLIIPAISPMPDEESLNQVKRPAVDAALHAIPLSEVIWFEDTVHDIPLHRPQKLADAITEFALKRELTGSQRS